MKSGIEKGREVPEWYKNPPPISKGDRVYMAAFWDLSSCRQSGGGTMGRVPWTAVAEYAEKWLGWDRRGLRRLWTIVGKLDDAYRKWSKDEHDKATRLARAGKARGGTGGASRTYAR